MIHYIPISLNRESMLSYLDNSFCREVFDTYQEFYGKTGFTPPWTGYFVVREGQAVGAGGFKGGPTDGKVEIAYGTVPEYEGRGISSLTCAYLTRLARRQVPGIRVVARTLREESASTSILRKNGFVFNGEVMDPEDGLVWEWEYGR